MSMERAKLARVVFSTKVPFSSFLSEKAMAWTTKSIVPKVSSTLAKAASMETSSVTSQGMRVFTPIESANGCTRFSMASMMVKAISAPWDASTLAMPQAMESLLATPMTTPRLPASRVPGVRSCSSCHVVLLAALVLGRPV